MKTEDVMNTIELRLHYVDGIAVEKASLSVFPNNLINANVKFSF